MTDIKVSQEAAQSARCLQDYLSIRGLKDGEAERAFARFEAQIVERCAKVADDELVEIFEDSPEIDTVCNAIVRNIATAIRTGGQS
jgi:hypothetical protein